MKTESFITLLIGAGLGIILGQANIFGLMIITVILIILFIVIGFARLSSENKFTSQALFLTILSFSMVISCGVGRSIDSETAEDIMIKLDEYKNVNGNYPASLNEIGIEKTKYSYYVDSLQEDFSISYIVDGWHYSEYSSKTKEWITTD